MGQYSSCVVSYISTCRSEAVVARNGRAGICIWRARPSSARVTACEVAESMRSAAPPLQSAIGGSNAQEPGKLGVALGAGWADSFGFLCTPSPRQNGDTAPFLATRALAYNGGWRRPCLCGPKRATAYFFFHSKDDRGVRIPRLGGTGRRVGQQPWEEEALADRQRALTC